jgi:predicted dehydrogenase
MSLGNEYENNGVRYMLKIGICGAGSFAEAFIPLFKAHPLVEKVVLAKLIPERREQVAAKCEIEDTFASR